MSERRVKIACLSIGEISTKYIQCIKMSGNYGKNHYAGDNTKLARWNRRIQDHSRIFKNIPTGCMNTSEVTSDMSNKYCNKIED